tara:strand:- start:75 stop:362 length:288 start_codon:yes stop_codon:yes gene_type:complete
MSYALQNPVFAKGQAALVIPAATVSASLTISVKGILSSDTVLLTLDAKGASASLGITTLPFVGIVIADTSIGAMFGIENTSVVEQTLAINWAVLR